MGTQNLHEIEAANMSSTSPATTFEKNVFINCPFDDEYRSLLQPLLFSLIYLGFIPRIASERSNAGEQRIDKIYDLIGESKYGIHDLSRLKAVKVNEYYRLNMPLELGLDLGSRRFAGGRFKEKKLLILSTSKYEYSKAVSDLSGVDIKAHDDEAVKIVRAVRNWLKEFVSDSLPAPTVIWEQFNYFISDFNSTRTAEGFSADDIYEMPAHEFIDFITEWMGART